VALFHDEIIAHAALQQEVEVGRGGVFFDDQGVFFEGDFFGDRGDGFFAGHRP